MFADVLVGKMDIAKVDSIYNILDGITHVVVAIHCMVVIILAYSRTVAVLTVLACKGSPVDDKQTFSGIRILLSLHYRFVKRIIWLDFRCVCSLRILVDLFEVSTSCKSYGKCTYRKYS